MYEDIAEIIIEKLKEPRIKVIETKISTIVFSSISSRNDIISLLEFLNSSDIKFNFIEVYIDDENTFTELNDDYELYSFILKNRNELKEIVIYFSK